MAAPTTPNVNALPHEYVDVEDLDAMGNSTFASRRKARATGRTKRVNDPARNKRIEDVTNKERPIQPKQRGN